MTIAEKVFQNLKAAPASVAQEVLDFIEFLESRNRIAQPAATKELADFCGVLKDSKAFADDPVAIQRKLRDEWR